MPLPGEPPKVSWLPKNRCQAELPNPFCHMTLNTCITPCLVGKFCPRHPPEEWSCRKAGLWEFLSNIQCSCPHPRPSAALCRDHHAVSLPFGPRIRVKMGPILRPIFIKEGFQQESNSLPLASCPSTQILGPGGAAPDTGHLPSPTTHTCHAPQLPVVQPVLADQVHTMCILGVVVAPPLHLVNTTISLLQHYSYT